MTLFRPEAIGARPWSRMRVRVIHRNPALGDNKIGELDPRFLLRHPQDFSPLGVEAVEPEARLVQVWQRVALVAVVCRCEILFPAGVFSMTKSHLGRHGHLSLGRTRARRLPLALCARVGAAVLGIASGCRCWRRGVVGFTQGAVFDKKYDTERYIWELAAGGLLHSGNYSSLFVRLSLNSLTVFVIR